MEFLYEYGLFFAKSATVVVVVGLILAMIIGASQKNKDTPQTGAIDVTKINDQYDETKQLLKKAITSPDILKSEEKAKKKQAKADKKSNKKAKSTDEIPETETKRIYVLDFEGDIKASAVESFREEITAVLSLATPEDEVIVCLESAGGMVHSYGLASSQLARITNKKIPLTVCVDKVAASGGYMMACVANKICAAPFAILGSIGVVAQLPNFHRLLKKNDIDVELMTAGEHKRTLTMFGENTDKGRDKFAEDLETTHELFKQFVRSQRPTLNIDAVATGEIWFGSQAKEQGLVDELTTSDDYILSQVNDADIYAITYVTKKSLPERLGLSVQSALETTVTSLINKMQHIRFL